MIQRLSDYPPVLPTHPWFEAEQQRLAAIQLWLTGSIDEAKSLFVQCIRQSPLFPFGCSTYHRFLHLNREVAGIPKDEILTISQPDLFLPFQFYRFFGRCQVANYVATKGWNGFEPPCPLILARWLRSVGGTYCDVGANSGYYTLLALASGIQRVVAFEPFAPAQDILRSNLELNGWSDRVDIRSAAIDDHDHISHFYLPAQTHGLLETSASQDPGFRPQHSFEFDVAAVRLDSLLDEVSLTSPLTIKIDVEGVAPTIAALRGAAFLVKAKRPVIMMEYLEGPAGKLDEFLRESAYGISVARPDGSIVSPDRILPFPDQPNHFLVPNELKSRFFNVLLGR